MLSKANASTILKASFVVMASPPNGSSARGRRRLRSSRMAATEMLCNDIILIPISHAGAVVRYGFAPHASFGVRLSLFERAHSSTEKSLVAGFHLPPPYGSAH